MAISLEVGLAGGQSLVAPGPRARATKVPARQIIYISVVGVVCAEDISCRHARGYVSGRRARNAFLSGGVPMKNVTRRGQVCL
ncbi:hypothetical protein OE88DRAFT_1659002 [Heliocybe sulcata]|uniref:Uncharacterized protein n=1 Tax=Heliocybe sulcata TaxID=5364 RepID=A0A5C3N1W1_9AGAM|nr:hypothetical protein OE88DRAFT_1659002 [Heliocybe sulcata]